MILPSFANAAELFKNLKLDGQIDVDGITSRNILDFATRQDQTGANVGAGVTNNDRLGNVQERLMLGLDWDLLDDVHGKVSITKNDRTWGTAGDNAAGANPAVNGNSQTVNAAGANVLGSIVVDQAYFKVDKVFGAVDTTIGRQYYGTAGDLIIYIGPSDKPEYGNPTNAIDAFKANWSNDKVGVEALAGELKGTLITNVPTAGVAPIANKDLAGIIATIKANDNVSGSLYTWNLETHGTGALGADAGGQTGFLGANGKNDNLYVTGAKVKYNGGGAWFNGEFAKDWGDNRVGGATNSLGNSMRYKGWAVLADLGYKADLSGAGAVTGWGNFGYGTGQHDNHSNENRGFTAIAGDYRPGDIYGRFAPYNGGANPVSLGGTSLGGVGTGNGSTNSLNNRVITGLGLKFNPAGLSKLTIGIAAWDFHTATVFAPVNPTTLAGTNVAGGGVAGGQKVFSGNKHLGYETDLDLTWKHSDNVTFAAGGGRFMPGGIFAEANQSGNVLNGSANSGQALNPALLAFFDVRVKF